MKKILTLAVFALAASLSAQVSNPTVLTYWTPQAISTGNTFAITQNKETYTAYDIPYAVIANSVCLRPTTADNTATNNYSWALYGSSGVKVLDTGAIHGSTFASSTAPVCMSLATLAGTIPAGRYYASVTTNCATSCAVLGGIAAYATPLAQNQGATTAGGAANATITPPADSYGTTGNAPWFELHQ